MKHLNKLLVLGLLTIAISIGGVGCASVDNSDMEFNTEQLSSEMKSRGYEYKIQNMENELLSHECEYMLLKDSIIIDGKQVILYDTDVVIYSYEDNEEMENQASNINEDASIINNDGMDIEMGWPKTPHFYKKGKIIVQYIGDDEQIISDLNEIMGEQFAGCNWIIYEDLGKDYILLNVSTNEKITEVYDVGKERFLSAQEAIDSLNNTPGRQVDYKSSK